MLNQKFNEKIHLPRGSTFYGKHNKQLHRYRRDFQSWGGDGNCRGSHYYHYYHLGHFDFPG